MFKDNPSAYILLLEISSIHELNTMQTSFCRKTCSNCVLKPPSLIDLTFKLGELLPLIDHVQELSYYVHIIVGNKLHS